MVEKLGQSNKKTPLNLHSMHWMLRIQWTSRITGENVFTRTNILSFTRAENARSWSYSASQTIRTTEVRNKSKVNRKKEKIVERRMKNTDDYA